MKAVSALTVAVLTATLSLNAAAGDACLRAAHLSPDAPEVDIVITPPSSSEIVLTDVPFETVAAYSALAPATYQIEVLASGTTTSVLDFPVALASDQSYTVAVIGELGADTLEPLVFNDDPTLASPGNARVRFIHAAPDAPTVDITLTDGSVLFDDIAYKSASDYIEVPATSYDLQVRDETGAVVVLTLSNVTLAEGEVYTVFAKGLLAGNPDLGALIAVDAPNDCASKNYQKVYFDPAQIGQAVQIVQNGNTVEGAWYVYDAAGLATFYTFGGTLSGTTLSSDLLQFSGPALGAAWDASLVNSNVVGSVTVTFSEATDSAVLTFNIGSNSSTLNLQPYVPIAN